jgi:hypothetical protein
MTDKIIRGSNELAPPPFVVGNLEAKEVLRCWIADGSLHVSLAPMSFEDGAETWGLLLSDVARHIAQSFEQEGADTYKNARRRIRSQFDIEWKKPTGNAITKDLKKQ